MTPILMFRDLFPYGRGSLAWVRVYRSGAGVQIALAIDPSDNPGPSAINDAEGLYDALLVAFPASSNLRLLVRFPGDPRGSEWTEVLRVDGGVDFERREVAKLEALVGEPLPDPSEWTCAALGGAHHPLLELIPPPEPELDLLAGLGVVAVADLPWAHNPSSCRWHDRFEALRTTYPPDKRGVPPVGAHWFLALSEEDFDRCRYHQADWRRIAEVGVEVFKGMETEGTIDNALEAIHGVLGESAEARWCASLFVDPIVFEPEAESVTDGQHRSCALRASGADFCVAEIGDGLQNQPRPGDPRRRAAAEIATFWIARAAV